MLHGPIEELIVLVALLAHFLLEFWLFELTELLFLHSEHLLELVFSHRQLSGHLVQPLVDFLLDGELLLLELSSSDLQVGDLVVVVLDEIRIP